jgi:hypothetical protein
MINSHALPALKPPEKIFYISRGYESAPACGTFARHLLHAERRQVSGHELQRPASNKLDGACPGRQGYRAMSATTSPDFASAGSRFVVVGLITVLGLIGSGAAAD